LEGIRMVLQHGSKWPHRIKAILAAAGVLALTGPASGQEWVFGAGYADFAREASNDEAVLVLEYHNAPFYLWGDLDLGFAGVLVAHTDGVLFGGAGISGIYDLPARWFIEGSVMPGYYSRASSNNDLGSQFEIRSLLGLGYTLGSGSRVSVALTHKSNASTASENPGVNSIQLRYRRRF
jgi:lipid A 3-O-deacylase